MLGDGVSAKRWKTVFCIMRTLRSCPAFGLVVSKKQPNLSPSVVDRCFVCKGSITQMRTGLLEFCSWYILCASSPLPSAPNNKMRSLCLPSTSSTKSIETLIMDENIAVHKELHLLIDQYIAKLDECLDQKEINKTKVYLEVIKRSYVISQWIRDIALNFMYHKSSDITISEEDIYGKIHRLVENSLQQDLIECALDAHVSTDACPTNDDLHNILFLNSVDDPTSVAPSLMRQLTCNMFENKLLSCCSEQTLHSTLSSNDVTHIDEFCLSSCFENSRNLFENDLSRLRSSLGAGLSAVDLKISEISTKTDEKLWNNSTGINRLSEKQKDRSNITDWLSTCAFSSKDSDDILDNIEGLQNIHSNTFSWEGRMRQDIPCHLYTSELNEKEVLLNTDEGDAEKFCILFDSSEVLSEQDFVYDVLDLLLGIPSNTFLYDDKKLFQMKPFTRLARMSSESTLQICENFIECGKAFYKLKTFCSSINPEEGLILKGLKDGIYTILTAYMEYITSVKYNTPTVHVVRTDVLENALVLNSLIEICGLRFEGNTASEIPKGLGLLSYLNKISWLHKTKENAIMVAVLLKYLCTPYFSFLNKWMSEGICCDPFDEFQIEEDRKYLDRKDELYWKFAYTEHEDDNMRILPYEIKKFSHDILECGKTMRLLQNCDVQMFSLDYMTCNAPPSLSMLFSYDAVKCRMAECEQYILNKETFELKHKNGRNFSEDEFYIGQQIFIDQRILAEKIEKQLNYVTTFESVHDIQKNDQHVNLKRCKSFPNITLVKEVKNFDGILHKSVGILFSTYGYNLITVIANDLTASKEQNFFLNSWKFSQKKDMTNSYLAHDKFSIQNMPNKITYSNPKEEFESSEITESLSFQLAKFPPGSFMDCLLSLLVSEYGDKKENIYLFIQLISLQNLMLYNFRDVLNMRLHLTQNAIMDYVMNQLHFQDLLLCLKNTYFLQDESFSQHLCEKLFKWVMKCSSLGEFADWPILNKILTRSTAIPSLSNFPFLESASVNFVSISEEYLSKKNKFLRFFQFQFEIDWPLNVIIHKACITQYINIHSRILELEFLCWLLGKIWRLHFIDARSEVLQQSPQYRKVILYRFNMHQFVRVLRSCIHQDLGGPLWQFLLKSLNTKELSIDALEDIHLKYLEKALERCFLTQDTHHLHEILELLFRQVNTFCDAALAASWEMNPDTNYFESSNFPLLSDCYKRYTKCRDRFYESFLQS
ncbi:gamma-tubulin complex component 6-like isoform X2 [Argiope bruennichi]|uniref:gamma-tubulin complex component 6-like isoform X2 n=1 Tax=Argiope bruennichi TaxID=94029 RepID=UPI0024950B1E|nr:gamma-tubulin complex component 6-like isoform X2 [Argiope bruennichi]